MGGAGLGPVTEQVEVALVFDHHVAGLAQRHAVDHHVAGDHQAQTRAGPASVQPNQLRAHAAVWPGQRLAHGRLGQSVGQHGAIGERERAGQHGGGRGHGHGVMVIGGHAALKRLGRQDRESRIGTLRLTAHLAVDAGFIGGWGEAQFAL